MKADTERTIGVVYKVIIVLIALGTTGGAIVWRLARLETRVDAIYSKVESIERKLDGATNPQSHQRVAGVEGD